MLVSPTFLFIPVSSKEGIGEYMRSIIIADEVKRQWPQANIHFVISRQAPYATRCPYPNTLVNDTPTKEVRAVNQLMETLSPNIVVFDASGRKSQLVKAHQLGAKVIFISQHKKKRSRGLKLGRARVTDSHWVVQPKFVMGEISPLQRLKLKWLKKSAPIFIGPVFTPPNTQLQQLLLAKYQLTRNEFVLFNAGSGGHKVGSELAADIFAEVAKYAAKTAALKTLMIFGSNYPKALPQIDGVIAIKSLDNAEFINLLEASKAAVLSGGDTLLQGIAIQKPILTAPVSKDQPARIAVCEQHQLIMAATTSVTSLCQKFDEFIQDKNLEKLQHSMTKIDNINGLEIAINEIKKLM